MIYLVRHGETYWNRKHIMHGQYDIPLTYKGVQQAKQLAIKLKQKHFDICYCSPLQRAKKTANEILIYHRNIPVIYDDRLMEIKKGLLEGERVASENMLLHENPRTLDKYGIESKADFFLRVSSLLDEIIQKYPDKEILIVSHSGTVKMAMFYANAPKKYVDEAYYDLHIKNCDCIEIPNSKSVVLPKLKCYNNINKSFKEKKYMKIGVYPMVADVLHTGHLAAIEEAKNHCDYLIIALHCCPNYKNPVQTIYERYMQLRAVKWVDEIIPYTDINDAKTLLSSLNYDIYFLGEDHKDTEWECKDIVANTNKEIFYLPRKHNLSSTDIKSRIIASNNK